MKDPFEQLIDVCREALTYVDERLDRGEAEVRTRREQHLRIGAALAVLTGEKSARAVKAGLTWDRERRETAAVHIKRRHEAAKPCPRCKGNLQQIATLDGPELSCINCGHAVPVKAS